MNLTELREKIDNIDTQLVTLLEDRMLIVEEIAKIKKKKRIQIEDKEREQKIITKKSENSLILSKKEIEKIFIIIMEISKERQRKYICE